MGRRSGDRLGQPRHGHPGLLYRVVLQAAAARICRPQEPVQQHARPGILSFARTRVVVFWSKNPRPLLPRLGELEERAIHSLLHYTLNDYVTEGFEPNLPPLEERIDTFRACAERLGRDRVIWRFDPLLLTDRLDVGELLHRIGRLGDRLSGYTSKLVFSFADIRNYRRVAPTSTGRRPLAGVLARRSGELPQECAS